MEYYCICKVGISGEVVPAAVRILDEKIAAPMGFAWGVMKVAETLLSSEPAERQENATRMLQRGLMFPLSSQAWKAYHMELLHSSGFNS